MDLNQTKPKPRPDIVDLTPPERADQDLIKKDDSFPDVKPKKRLESDKYKGRTYDIYSVEIDGRETNVIEFKDGKRMSVPQIRQMFGEYKSASESIPGKQTSQEISKFLEDNNPTKEEFIRHFTAKRLNQGGLTEQMEMFGYTDEGVQQEVEKFVDKDAAPAKDITFMDAAKFVAELTPVIGDAMAAKEVYDELQKDDPNYLLAGALGGAAIIGLIPGIGDAAASAIRAGARKSLDVAKRVEVDPDAVGAMGGNIRLKPKEEVTPQLSNIEYQRKMAEFDKAETVEEWQKNVAEYVKKSRDVNPTIRTPELEKSTKDLLDNKITREQHLANIDKYKPVDPWDSLPREPSSKSTVFSLNAAQRKDGNFVLPDKAIKNLNVKKANLKVGDRFLGRLDIPAYKAFDTWIIAGKSPKGDAGTTYAKAIHYEGLDGKPVIFRASQVKGEKIGMGKADPAYTKDTHEKTGYATIDGIVKDLDVEEIRAKATQYLNDPEWTQVGFDPRRQGGFYVRAGENKHVPVREASEVIQIGPLVLAKNAKLDMDYEGYNEGGVAMNEQMEMAFMQQGGIKDDGMNKDPVSGNPIPPGSMAKEVRDDIPAMLSEGEYVVPADVLRFYGVNFFEDLRNKAKSGLQNMEKNGRIGGEPLSPQQVQQNMGQSGVTMQANQGGAVGYQGGGGAIPDVYMDQAKALNPNPIDLSQYGVVGGSTFSSNPQAEANSITRTEIYVNAETGDTRSVNFVSSGTETKIVPPSDEQYTRPPYYLQGSSALKKAQQTVPTGGGGSDPKDPPEPKPKQPFGIDVDWSDPKAYADSLLEGPDGLPKSVQMLSALAGPLGMAAVGGANAAMTLGKISDLRAAKIIAQAQGDTSTSEYIDKELGKFIKRSPNIVSFLEKAVAPGTSKAKEVLDRLGLDYEEDKKGNITFTERMQELNNRILRETRMFSAAGRKELMTQFEKDKSGGVYKPGGIDVALGQGSSSDKDYNAAQAASRAAAAARRAAMEEAQAAGGSSDDIADLKEKYEEAGGTWASGGRAEGGLMTKAKKKK